MNREECLREAEKAVCARPRYYGSPAKSFARTAELWNAHLINTGCENYWLQAWDVAIMMGLLKIARLEASSDHADSWADAAGYMACGAEIATAGDRVWLEDILQQAKG